MPVLSGEPRNPALEAAIVADPDDTASYAVYGDWLSEQGDPRGELIAAQLAADALDTPAARLHAIAVLGRDRARYLGALDDQLVAAALDWRAGFLRRAELGLRHLVHTNGARADVPLQEVAAGLLANPSARFLAELVIDDRSNVRGRFDISALIAALAAGLPATLRTLSLGDLELESHTNWGRLDAVWARVPGLRALSINGKFRCDAISLPHVEQVALRCFDVIGRQARAVAEAHWPRLRALRLIGGWNNSDTHRHLTAVLDRARHPALTDLALIGMGNGDELLDRLVASTALPGLRSLDLRHSTLTDRCVRTVATHAAAFAQLSHFDVTGCRLSRIGLDRLRRVVPHLIAGGAGGAT